MLNYSIKANDENEYFEVQANGAKEAADKFFKNGDWGFLNEVTLIVYEPTGQENTFTFNL